MKENKFKVGDEVAVMRPGSLGQWSHLPMTTSIVAKVHKKYLVLSDGSKWTLQGYVYPKVSHYLQSHITHLTQEHKDQIQCYKLWGILERQWAIISKNQAKYKSSQLEELIFVFKKILEENKIVGRQNEK